MDAPGRVVYGIGVYMTDCGRFLVTGDAGRWQLGALFMANGLVSTPESATDWDVWLHAVGLFPTGTSQAVSFARRQDALAALHTALCLHGLLHASTPG